MDDIETFWQTMWDFFDVQADGSRQPVLDSQAMPGAEWCPNARILKRNAMRLLKLDEQATA